MKLGQAVTLNGNLSPVNIIVAKRKPTVEKRMFSYDYMSMNNYAFWMIRSEFTEEMIKSVEDVQIIKMPDLYEDYNTDEQIKRAYASLKESFENKDKSFEFDFISEESFTAIVKNIVKNTFNKKIA